MKAKKNKPNTDFLQAINNNEKTMNAAMEYQRKQFAKRLKTFRKNAKLTQQQLADISGIGKSIIGRYETGGALPRSKAIERLAIALNVSVADLDGSRTTTIDTLNLKNILNGYGVLAEFSKGDKVLLNSIELPTKIEISIPELLKLLNDTKCKTDSFIEPIRERFFQEQLIRNIISEFVAKSEPIQKE